MQAAAGSIFGIGMYSYNINYYPSLIPISVAQNWSCFCNPGLVLAFLQVHDRLNVARPICPEFDVTARCKNSSFSSNLARSVLVLLVDVVL